MWLGRIGSVRGSLVILGCGGPAGTLTLGAFRSTEVGPLNLTGTVTFSAFAGDLFVTVGAIAVVRPRPPLDVKDFSLAFFAFQPGHWSSSFERATAAGDGGRRERVLGLVKCDFGCRAIQLAYIPSYERACLCWQAPNSLRNSNSNVQIRGRHRRSLDDPTTKQLFLIHPIHVVRACDL